MSEPTVSRESGTGDRPIADLTSIWGGATNHLTLPANVAFLTNGVACACDGGAVFETPSPNAGAVFNSGGV